MKLKKIIGIIVSVGILVSGSFYLGITQSKVVPNGYIALEDCIPLEDISYCYIGPYDYPCFEIGDITNQFDDFGNRSYEDIMDNLEDGTTDFRENFIDMREIIDFVADENGLQIYLSDGTGYYWER